MSAAERVRRHRARRRKGQISVRVEVDEFELHEALVEAGYLQQWDCEDREKVEAALQRANIRILPSK